MPYQIKLETFEGPLDLLLHLIEKEEMDIYDIQISVITEQYLQYIQTMQSLKLDVTSEFLVMASTLLAIKSKMLLPTQNVNEFEPLTEMDLDEDPREELVQRLLEYKKYKQLSTILKEKELERSQIYSRPMIDLSLYRVEQETNPVDGLNLYHVIDAFQKALKKYSYRDPITKIEREEISVSDRMNEILELLLDEGILFFSKLISQANSKSDIVVTFLSILELMKVKKIVCVQTVNFDEIVIHYNEEREGAYGLQ